MSWGFAANGTVSSSSTAIDTAGPLVTARHDTAPAPGAASKVVSRATLARVRRRCPTAAREDSKIVGDLLDAVLDLAAREGALDEEGRRAFARGFRDRARLVLEERLAPVLERAAALEKETAWRAETVAALEAERAALREDLAKAATAHDRLLAQDLERREHVAAVEAERASLEAEWRRATEAHARLLDHHRAVLADVASILEAAAAALPPGELRGRVEELGGALRREMA
jgi:chromosome segregation ATPase